MLKETDVKNSENVSGIKVLVTRYFPRGFKKSDGTPFTIKDFNFWFKELAPSSELLNEYFSFTTDEKQFRERYVKEVLTNQNAVEEMKKVYDMAKTSDVYLICREPNGYFCHRHILLKIIEDLSEVFEKDKKCPYFLGENYKFRCALKCFEGGYRFHYAPSRKRRRELIIWHKTVGDVEKCDFAYYQSLEAIRESKLKDCVYYTGKTGAFTCSTCYFRLSDICLLKKKKLVACENYVHEELKFGNFYIIYQIVQLSKAGIDLKKLLTNYLHGRKISETGISIIKHFVGGS
jgi:uncharacterized protein YeaO (DUF488 family)